MKNASSTHILIQHMSSLYGRLKSADAPLWLNLFFYLFGSPPGRYHDSGSSKHIQHVTLCTSLHLKQFREAGVYTSGVWVGPVGAGAHILTVLLLIYALPGKLQRKSNPPLW